MVCGLFPAVGRYTAALLKRRATPVMWPNLNRSDWLCLLHGAGQAPFAISGTHSFAEAMLLFALKLFGLISPDHETPSFQGDLAG
jgi:hypothetical protein